MTHFDFGPIQFILFCGAFLFFKYGKKFLNPLKSLFIIYSSPPTKNSPVLFEDLNKNTNTTTSFDENELPSFVVKRITDQKNGRLPWTSDLSVKEWYLLQKYKIKPLGMVIGAASFHIGFSEKSYLQNASSISRNQEFSQVVNAMKQACDVAQKRLQAEAILHGANAVVGIRIKLQMPNKNNQQCECQLIGTAVNIADIPQLSRPLLCTCTTSELIKLIDLGDVPKGLGLGISIFYSYTNFYTDFLSKSGKNTELSDYSNALNVARRYAMTRLKHSMEQLNGNGVLAKQMHYEIQEIENSNAVDKNKKDFLIHFIYLGTVIDTQKLFKLPPIKLAVPLT